MKKALIVSLFLYCLQLQAIPNYMPYSYTTATQNLTCLMYPTSCSKEHREESRKWAKSMGKQAVAAALVTTGFVVSFAKAYQVVNEWNLTEYQKAEKILQKGKYKPKKVRF